MKIELTITTVLVIALLLGSYGLSAQDQWTAEQGRIDGRKAGRQDTNWGMCFAGGVVGGLLIPQILLAFSPRQLNAERLPELQDKPPEYVEAYIAAYKQAKRRTCAQAAGIGAITTAGLLLYLYAVQTGSA